MNNKSPHVIDIKLAPTLLNWFKDRGGVLGWQNVALDSADCGAFVYTPKHTADSQPVTSPNWRCPESVEINDPAEFVVREYKQVATRKRQPKSMSVFGQNTTWRYDPVEGLFVIEKVHREMPLSDLAGKTEFQLENGSLLKLPG